MPGNFEFFRIRARNHEQHGHTKEQHYLTVKSHDPFDAHVKIKPLLLPINWHSVPSQNQ